MLRSDAAMVRASLTVLARLATCGLVYSPIPTTSAPALRRLRPGERPDEDEEREEDELQTLHKHRDRTSSDLRRL